MCNTNEISGSSAQVFSTNSDFGPRRALIGRDPSHQWGLAGTRHPFHTYAKQNSTLLQLHYNTFLSLLKAHTSKHEAR